MLRNRLHGLLLTIILLLVPTIKRKSNTVNTKVKVERDYAEKDVQSGHDLIFGDVHDSDEKPENGA